MIDLSAYICGMKFDPALCVESGFFSQPQLLEVIAKLGVGGVIAKSTGMLPEEGNMEPVIVKATEETMLNSMKLPNPGREIMRDELKAIYPLTNGKLLGSSVVGKNKYEFVEVARCLSPYSDFTILNISCPNDKRGLIARFPDQVYEITRAVKEVVKKPVGVKLTPNVYDICETAMAADQGGADFISADNTISDGMVINIYARRPVLSAKFGGISGRGIKSKAVGDVYKIYEKVKKPIMGIGGVGTAEDVIEFKEAGADVIGLGSAMFCPYGKILSTKEIGYSLANLRRDLENILEGEYFKDISRFSNLKGAGHHGS
jgi:dihydroorotate dehydrogenase (NAD+) catalytic subunit